MDNKCVSRELDTLRRVLNYNGVRESSFLACLAHGVAYFAGLFFLSLSLLVIKAGLYGFNDVDRLNSLVVIIYTFLVGFLSMIFITAAKSMFVSLPYCYRCNSKLCCKMKGSFKYYTSKFFVWYLMILCGCISLSLNGSVFITMTLMLLAFICIRMKKTFDRLEFKKIIDEVNLQVIFKRYSFPESNEYYGMKNEEHNPATGLPMVGSVDVGGNPYGYSHHD